MIWMIAIAAVAAFAQAQQQKGAAAAQNTVDQSNADSTNIVNKANAEAANATRAANNDFQAAQAVLSNTQRSISNRETMRAMGDQYNALETNLTRTMDSMVRGRLAAQLQGAAALGALRADSASRGVGGSSSAVIQSTAELATGAAITQADDNKKYVQYDTLLQKSGLQRAAVANLDFGQSLPQFDYGINIAPLATAPINTAQYINPAMSGLLAGAGAYGQYKASQSIGRVNGG